jgi:hypothetical protein
VQTPVFANYSPSGISPRSGIELHATKAKTTIMSHPIWAYLAILFLVGFPCAVTFGDTLPTKPPTIYLVAKADYGGDPSSLSVRGATNLPYRSLLVIYVYDSIGQGSRTLNIEAIVQVPRDGFFETTVKAAPGQRFRHNMVCDVSFSAKYPHQDKSVLAVVGSEGERLGFPKNPQVEQQSGEYSLGELIHVP